MSKILREANQNPEGVKIDFISPTIYRENFRLGQIIAWVALLLTPYETVKPDSQGLWSNIET